MKFREDSNMRCLFKESEGIQFLFIYLHKNNFFLQRYSWLCYKNVFG